MLEADAFSSVPCLIGKCLIENRSVRRQIRRLLDPLKSACEAGTEVITDIINQFLVERVIPTDWGLTLID